MPNINVQLKNAGGDILYPQTDWNLVQNKPSIFYDSRVLSNCYTPATLQDNKYVCFCKIKIKQAWGRVAVTCALNCARYFSGFLSITWWSQTFPAVAPFYDIKFTGAIQEFVYQSFGEPIIFTYSETTTTVYGWAQTYDGNLPQILYLLQNLSGAQIESLDTNNPIYTSSLPGDYGVKLQMRKDVSTSNFTDQYTSDDLINDSLFN